MIATEWLSFIDMFGEPVTPVRGLTGNVLQGPTGSVLADWFASMDKDFRRIASTRAWEIYTRTQDRGPNHYRWSWACGLEYACLTHCVRKEANDPRDRDIALAG